MHTHDFFVDQSNQWHMIERVVESLPQRYFITSLDLVEEAVDPSDSLALVVTSEHHNLLREAALERV